jgi:hypothetical protein
MITGKTRTQARENEANGVLDNRADCAMMRELHDFLPGLFRKQGSQSKIPAAGSRQSFETNPLRR